MTRRILCFGDSLTWGWIAVPEGAPTTRFSLSRAWTGVMALKLGPDYEIVEEALNARTTSIDDPVDPRLNGSAYLPVALASHFPLDLVIIMLGTNDTKSYYRRTSYEIAVGMSKLVCQVLTSAGGLGTVYPAPRVLVVAPPPLGPLTDPWLQEMFDCAREKMLELAKQYRALAGFMKGRTRKWQAATICPLFLPGPMQAQCRPTRDSSRGDASRRRRGPGNWQFGAKAWHPLERTPSRLI
ncbi:MULTISPECIES: GDSL-type esterase/lipase family protein [unclassified Bradyrhizobium]|uniref:GDSL-type esterase/lipase family protein n=1 Tax=unclassified Bradyrhizobium TaxID=2631580 RepID=UPI0024794195|nr:MULTISPECIES: GDSL-type esterase/lipase family protein [unclassified Bradyrhizobium]WGS22967.1 GDSL-type esterase/lipase family protein [Bradyrhizobium sp. ISRA463]WGS29969.1 GDSL-type esterase/lipase family protein [Bradyrhizobium sp. ISRA464]